MVETGVTEEPAKALAPAAVAQARGEAVPVEQVVEPRALVVMQPMGVREAPPAETAEVAAAPELEEAMIATTTAPMEARVRELEMAPMAQVESGALCKAASGLRPRATAERPAPMDEGAAEAVGAPEAHPAPTATSSVSTSIRLEPHAPATPIKGAAAVAVVAADAAAEEAPEVEELADRSESFC